MILVVFVRSTMGLLHSARSASSGYMRAQEMCSAVVALEICALVVSLKPLVYLFPYK